MKILDSIQRGTFSIVVEFTPHNAQEVASIAEIGKGLVELNKKYEANGIQFVGVSLTQNPGGSVSYDHQATLSILREKGFPEELEIIPHVTGKDMNADALRALLPSLAERGIKTVLALTGDVSAAAKGVFEVDSLGLLQLVNEVNITLLKKGRDLETFASLSILDAGAAVSPFKYTEASWAMQIIKVAKKVREGARFLVCQSGWDSERSEQLVKALGSIGVPLQGNVLVVNEAAAKYMKTLPGCVVTDAFLDKLSGESVDDNLKRASRQVAMFRQLGYSGIDLGKPGEFRSVEEIEKIIDGALEITDWCEFKDDITFAPIVEQQATAESSAGFSKAFHNAVFEKEGLFHGPMKAMLGVVNESAEKNGIMHRVFNAVEGFGKGIMYECQHCGDCYLPENNYVCTRGGCTKGLDNPPCGDATPDGHCGNDANRMCAGERIYKRLEQNGSLEAFKEGGVNHRNPALQDTPSLLNYFFEKDHNARKNPLEGSGLIQIAELLHASIPVPGAAMQFIKEMGAEGFIKPNRGLAMIKYLIVSQSEQGADYIDINIDALGCENAPEVMREYVRQVHRHGRGTPPCIDSSDIEVLKAGLDEWFNLGDDLRSPLLNSISFVERDKFDSVLAIRARKPFSAIFLLMGEAGPLEDSGKMVEAARVLFRMAEGAGFKADEMFFDTVTLGIASDGCMDPMGMTKPSHTHHSFHAIQLIRTDAEMKGCHAVLGVSNWVYGATKRRIGHIRAFIAAGQDFGLDAAIVDVDKGFGVKPVASELKGFVETFISLDGDEDSMMTYSMAMQNARQSNWI